MENTDKLYGEWNGKTFLERHQELDLKLQHEKDKNIQMAISKFLDRDRVNKSAYSLNEEIERFIKEQEQRKGSSILSHAVREATEKMLRVRNTFANLLSQVCVAFAFSRRAPKSKTPSR